MSDIIGGGSQVSYNPADPLTRYLLGQSAVSSCQGTATALLRLTDVPGLLVAQVPASNLEQMLTEVGLAWQRLGKDWLLLPAIRLCICWQGKGKSSPQPSLPMGWRLLELPTGKQDLAKSLVSILGAAA